MPDNPTTSAAENEVRTPRPASIPLPSMFAPGVDTEAAMRALASLSSRIEMSRPTPEIAVVEMARQMTEQYRLLTDAAMRVLSASKDQSAETRIAAIESRLLDVTERLSHALTQLAAKAADSPVRKEPESGAENEATPPSNDTPEIEADAVNIDALEVPPIAAPQAPPPRRKTQHRWI